MEKRFSEIPPAPTFDELMAFLNEKAPGFSCLVCKGTDLELARQRSMKGKTFRPSITLVGPEGPYQEYSFYTSCAQCGAVQMFDLRAFRRWKESRDGERGEPSTGT